MYGICKLTAVPVRASGSSIAEQTNQLLLGDRYKVLSSNGDWIFIETLSDMYTGWINILQHSTINNNDTLNKTPYVFTHFPFLIAINTSLNQNQIIPFGASLYDIKLTANNTTFSIDDEFFLLNQIIENKDIDLIELAKLFLNTPYLWGGRTAIGIDCSGYTQLLFKGIGIAIKRDAWQQAQQGNVVDFISETQAGDLAFFDNNEGRITHVGILLNNAQIIHASGKVKIENIDNYGILSNENKNYSHKLRLIKRIKL